jgi:hypothetical protein
MSNGDLWTTKDEFSSVTEFTNALYKNLVIETDQVGVYMVTTQIASFKSVISDKVKLVFAA